ncbi:MAG TPA: hypothetical protein VI456_02655 [Polyangia bacterium]
MARSSRHRFRLGLSGAGGLALVAALVATGCTVYPSSTPSEPAFDTDVRPIFEAHCTRCHGAGPDGGTLNTFSTPNYDGGLGCPTSATATGGPFLTTYCTPDANGVLLCAMNPKSKGAGFYALTGTIHQVLHDLNGTCEQMPPPPAPALNDWELSVIDTWAAEQPQPTCSTSPNPDPDLLCPPSDAGM